MATNWRTWPIASLAIIKLMADPTDRFQAKDSAASGRAFDRRPSRQSRLSGSDIRSLHVDRGRRRHCRIFAPRLWQGRGGNTSSLARGQRSPTGEDLDGVGQGPIVERFETVAPKQMTSR